MDYEKLYKESLERARAGKPMDEVFPELKESDDERIRKAIGAAICGTTAETVLEANGVKLVDALAYLKKQKEPKSFNDTQEYLEGVERVQGYDELTKFEKVFDRIANTYAHRKNKDGYNKPWYVKERAAEMLYHAKEELGLCLEQKSVECSEEDEAMLESIIKDYDYLCRIWLQDYEKRLGWADCEARREIRNQITWLKSLRPQLKREDWTDEDSLAIKEIQNALQIYMINSGISEEQRKKLARWLDIHCNAYPLPAKLYPHWKPTKEQIDAIHEANYRCRSYQFATHLTEIEIQLEKLMNE